MWLFACFLILYGLTSAEWQNAKVLGDESIFNGKNECNVTKAVSEKSFNVKERYAKI